MAEGGRARGRARGLNGFNAPGANGEVAANRNNGNAIGAEQAALPRGGLAPRGGGAVDIALRMERLNAARAKRVDTNFTPHTRPQQVTHVSGKGGQPVDLVCNFFRIQGGPTWCMYEYHVDFEPEIDLLSVRRALVRPHEDKIGEIYNFTGANLITPRQMDKDQTWQSRRDSDGAIITLRVRLTGEISPDSEEAVRIFNMVVRQMQNGLQLVQIKRDFFDPAAAITMPNHSLTIWPGYPMTITKYENELLLNMDIIHRVMRTDTVFGMLQQIFQQARTNKVDPREAAARELIGRYVVTKYNNKTRRIDDILWPPQHTPMSSFQRRGQAITFADYYRVQYNIEIGNTRQPLLVTRHRKMNRRLQEENPFDMLVPELCYMTELTEGQRSNFHLMREFKEITRLNPANRLQRYSQFGQRVSSSAAARQILSNWNLHLERQPLQLTGRQLDVVKLHTGVPSQNITPDKRTAEWSNALKNMTAFDPVHLFDWGLVYSRRDEGVAREFVESLGGAANGMGIQVGQPQTYPLDNNRAVVYKQACSAVAQIPNCRMIICILGSKDRQTYEAIKKFTLVDVGIPSQCVVVTTLRKGMLSVCTKVMQQICVKLGGALWKVPITLIKTMICGFDTYHDSSARGRSVGGFVATIDDQFTKFFSKSFQHDVRGELSHYLMPCLAEAIKVFSDRNGCHPQRILFYRDGVADNQLKVVYETEVQQLLRVALQFGENYQPRMSVIVVQKRIRPRFFAVRRNETSNPEPGTVVDNKITDPRCYEFYIISQAARQGTVTPCRYNIIHESTNLTPDQHHQLAYELSHLYYNWPGTIRVVAPCHYAHKLAFLIGQHIHTNAHRNLSTKLYYL